MYKNNCKIIYNTYINACTYDTTTVYSKKKMIILKAIFKCIREKKEKENTNNGRA